MNKTINFSQLECEAIRDWYMFVEKDQRSHEDGLLNEKVTKIVQLLSQSEEYDLFKMEISEIQIASKWYYMIPVIIRDNVDKRVIKRMERFISKQANKEN